MPQQLIEYVYVIERGDDGAYWAYVPDLPGCATTSPQPEDIQRLIAEAVDVYLSYYRERNLPPPPAHARTGVVAA